MPDKILAAIRRENNPSIVINTFRRPVIRFNRPTRGIVSVDGANIAFADTELLELPLGAKVLSIREIDQESPLIFVEDAA